MMRSLFSAISGMRNHMSYMDVVGNNIANVNTTAYKASRVTFQDILSQNIKGASRAQGGRGGTNPAQIGLGTTLSGIDNVMSQGSLQSTGKLTDMAIQGDGFFVVSDGSRNYYTRDGAFDIGVDGGLVNPSNGLRVMGWMVDATGNVTTNGPMVPIKIPFGAQISVRPTTNMKMEGNLDKNMTNYNAGPPAVGVVTTTVSAYDNLGNPRSVKMEFRKTGADTWTANPFYDDTDADGSLNNMPSPANFTLNFDATTGALTSPGPFTATFSNLPGTPAPAALGITFDFSKLSQIASPSQVALSSQDGSPGGALVNFSVAPTGEISGIFSDGSSSTLGQLATASFVNPAGLLRNGQNLWTQSPNSGDATIGTPGQDGRGTVGTGILEGSNVDLAQQFTNVIIAQRGFQSSSRVITATDQMLQDLVNIVR
ncbi:hypothetical protein AYO38_02885 [bacterium SCGC AG-212-C10]|nr:hypothetical protein AYO38_02885 [bacterium SCGC AG-212-C10]